MMTIIDIIMFLITIKIKANTIHIFNLLKNKKIKNKK